MESFRARPFLKEQLLRPAKTGRTVHAQILSGPEGTGRHTAAKFIAQSLNCTGEGERPCGACPSCLRFQNGDYTDLITVNPDGTQIKVEQVRAVIEQVAIHPETGYKCVIFYPADRMNESAQNALLKTLEEAPECVVFFLITDKPSLLLSTIRSRCVSIRFSVLSDEEVLEVLHEKIAREDADMNAAIRKRAEIYEKQPREAPKMPTEHVLEMAAKRSGGSVGAAIELISDFRYDEVYKLLTDLITSLKAAPGGVSAVSGSIAALKDHGKLIALMLETCASELMRQDENPSPLTQALIALGVDGAKLMDGIITFRSMLDSYVGFQSAFELLLYNITTGDN